MCLIKSSYEVCSYAARESKVNNYIVASIGKYFGIYDRNFPEQNYVVKARRSCVMIIIRVTRRATQGAPSYVSL
jgi:hypothetical protein